jgi:hypothetical protein
MSALATLDSQRKEMNTAIKNLLKTGELVCEDEDFARAEFLLRLLKITRRTACLYSS